MLPIAGTLVGVLTHSDLLLMTREWSRRIIRMQDPTAAQEFTRIALGLMPALSAKHQDTLQRQLADVRGVYVAAARTSEESQIVRIDPCGE